MDIERDVSAPALAEPTAEAWWKKMRVGTMVLIWDGSNAQSCLSMMEVIDYNGEEREFKGWYHIHHAAAAVYRFEHPQCSML